MKPVRIPHSLPILFLVLVAVTFLVGTVHAFGSAYAAASTPPVAKGSGQVDRNTNLSPKPVSTHLTSSEDTTTGVIALAIVIVVIVLVGAALGQNSPISGKLP
jgi:hypothetical protein